MSLRMSTYRISTHTFAIFSSTVFFLLSFPSCIRYVPSRAELAKQSPSKLSEDLIASPEQFQLYQKEQAARLDTLIQERRHAMENQPTGVYKLGPGDLLKMEVLGLDDMTTEFAVEPSGIASLHLIGEVQFANREVWEVRQDITQKLRKYLRNPQVKLSLQEVRANQVSVIGEVKSPGVYPLSYTGQTISDVLSKAGGRNERAGHQLILIPAHQGESSVSTSAEPSVTPTIAAEATPNNTRRGIALEFDSLYGNVNSEPLQLPLLAGDVIVVPEAGKVSVDGEVNSPGSYPLGSGTTVLGAVAAAGGLTYAAKVGEVELVRGIGEGKRAMVVLDLEQLALNSDLDLKVLNGDLLRVPSDSGRFERRQVVEVLNRVFKVGVSGGVR